jgi:hypothetical protein
MLAVGAFGLARPAAAVEFVDGNTIPAGEVIDDDVFIAGDTVVVDGDVNGDLFATGANVTVNGIVKGSLFTSAQNITVNGEVEGSLYSAGSGMQLGETAVIGRNLFFAGFSLEAMPGSQVGSDLVVASYQALLSGDVGRDVLAGCGALELDGFVGRNAIVDVGESGSETNFPAFFMPPGAPTMVSPGLRIKESAEIVGVLEYTSRMNQAGAIQIEPGGGVVYKTPAPTEGDPRDLPASVQMRLNIGEWFLKRLQDLITLLVIGLLAARFIPGLFTAWVARVRSTPLPSAGWGLIVTLLGYAALGLAGLVVLAVGILLGIITLAGLSGTAFGLGFSGLGLISTFFNLLVQYGSKLIVIALMGKLILERLSPNSATNTYWAVALGVFIYVLLRSIPVFGWIVAVIFTVLGVGAVWLEFRQKGFSLKPSAA